MEPPRQLPATPQGAGSPPEGPATRPEPASPPEGPATRPEPASSTGPPSPPAEARQRWRVTYRRTAAAPALAQREQLAAWEGSLIATGLPVAGLDLPVPRPRLVLAAPLTVGMAAEAELMDLFLVERRPVAEVRVQLAASMPPGHELIDAYDVWLGEPPVSGQVVAADYLVVVRSVAGTAAGTPARPYEPGPAEIERAARDLLAARTVPRSRDKGGRSVTYDLRPLLDALDVIDPAEGTTGGGVALRMRTRFDRERGVGRPEEVVAALGDALGTALEARSIVRERLILGSERPAGAGRSPSRAAPPSRPGT